VTTRSTTKSSARSQGKPAAVARIAAGVDGYLEGRDAAVLGATIAQAVGAELMLVAVHPDPLVPMPPDSGWKALHAQAEALLRDTRDTLAPGARITVETDWSVPRALERVVKRDHHDLLVVGSSRHAPDGQVRIGKRTRQLLCHSQSALAVAPRALSERQLQRLARVGVGYDGSAESNAALALAGTLADAAGAKLLVRGVVDDRMPRVGWTGLGGALTAAGWDEVIEQELASLDQQARRAAEKAGTRVQVEIVKGRPADALLKLSGDVDLLVIGSRRWGAVARLIVGSTGEALMHGAGCPVLVVPRPKE
jgi:nucleotide-binding universal stress UspA family protein